MLQIPLSPDAEEILRERAKASGEEVAWYAARLLQDTLVAPSVGELLAPHALLPSGSPGNGNDSGRTRLPSTIGRSADGPPSSDWSESTGSIAASKP
jgi:hypothetical protein